MRRLLARSVFALATVSTSPLAAQTISWMQTNGPFGGDVRSIVSVGDTVYAAAGPIFRSTNNGLDWTRAGTTPMFRYRTDVSTIQQLAIDSTGRLLAVSQFGLLASTNGGMTWKSADSNILYSAIQSMLVAGDGSIYRLSGNWLYRIRAGEGYSHDVVIDQFPDTVIAIAKAPSGRLFTILENNRVLISNDHGSSWQLVRGGRDTVFPRATQLIAVDNQRLFAATARGLLASTDGGSSWRVDTSSIRDRELISILYRDGALYVGTRGFGIQRSSDEGATWTRVIGGDIEYDAQALASNAGGTMFAGTYSGVHRSTNSGGAWEFTVRGMNALRIHDITVNRRGDVFVATDRGFFRSTDRGLDWKLINVGLASREMIEIESDASDNLYGLSDRHDLYHSIDGGGLWSRLRSLNGYSSVWSLRVDSSNALYFVGSRPNNPRNQLMRSTDKAASWEPIFENLKINDLAVSSYWSIIACTGDNGLFRYARGGNGWSQILSPVGQGQFGTVAADGLGGVYSIQARTFWRSVDDGFTWMKTDLNSDGDRLAVSRSGVLLMNTLSGTSSALISRDRGTSWLDASEGFDGLRTTLAMAPDATAYAGGFGVVRSVNPLASVRGEYVTSNTITVESPRPHPVRSVSRLHYTLAEKAHVRISLVNVVGAEIVELFDGMAEPGSHESFIDAAGLPAGVYTVHMQAGAVHKGIQVVVEHER